MLHQTPHEVFEEIRHEHAALRERLAEIHRTLEAGELPCRQLVPQLRELRDALRSHFAHEEQEGFFDEITADAPRLDCVVERLRNEHREMLDSAFELVELAAESGDAPIWRRELRERFLAFSRRLMHHESDENSLLQQAYQEDIGAHD